MVNRRRLRADECEIVSAMLSGKPACAHLVSNLNASVVEDMQDGGMGSIRFLSRNEERHPGDTVAEAEYTDEDGVLVIIALNTDDGGGLYELDFWKVDFSPLRRYPSVQELRIK